jgi:hypothetical protein
MLSKLSNKDFQVDQTIMSEKKKSSHSKAKKQRSNCWIFFMDIDRIIINDLAEQPIK